MVKQTLYCAVETPGGAVKVVKLNAKVTACFIEVESRMPELNYYLRFLSTDKRFQPSAELALKERLKRLKEHRDRLLGELTTNAKSISDAEAKLAAIEHRDIVRRAKKTRRGG